MPRGPRHRPSHSAFAPPVPPPPGPARRLLPLGTVVWSIPHPLPATPPSCRFVLGRGGRCPPLPSCIPHPWGGGGAWGGGGLTFSLRRSHVTGTRCGIRPAAGRGGYASWFPLSPFLPYSRPPCGLPAGACTVRALFGHGRVVRPATAASPPCRVALGGGVACRLPPTRTPRPRGGGGGWGGEVRPFRLPSVARTSQARRSHDTVTG